VIVRASRLIARHANVNWALADQSMVSGVNFLTGIMLARYLGLEEFGRFTLAWMAVLFVNSIQHAAINSPMMSIGPKQAPKDEPAYYGSVVAQQAIFGLAVFVVVWSGTAAVAAVFSDWNITGLALPLACAALTFQVQDFLRRYFFTRGRGGVAFATDALRYGGQLVILFWLFRTSEMNSAAALWVIAALAAFGALAVVPAVGSMAWNPETIRATVDRHWHFGKWLVGSALMQWASGQLFFIAAGAMLGAVAVGALKAAQTLMGVSHILLMGLENVVPVRAAKHLQDGGRNALYDYLRRVTIMGESAVAAIAVIAAVAPDFWFSLVFGDQYLGYGYLLRWFALLYLLMSLQLPLRAGIRATESTSIFFWAQVGATLVSLALVYPLLETLQLAGVLIGLIATQVITLATQFHGLRKALRSLPG